MPQSAPPLSTRSSSTARISNSLQQPGSALYSYMHPSRHHCRTLSDYLQFICISSAPPHVNLRVLPADENRYALVICTHLSHLSTGKRRKYVSYDRTQPTFWFRRFIDTCQFGNIWAWSGPVREKNDCCSYPTVHLQHFSSRPQLCILSLQCTSILTKCKIQDTRDNLSELFFDCLRIFDYLFAG